MSVGKSMRALREARGLTQAEVGRRAGIAASYLSRLETGRIQPTATTLGRVAEALGVEVGEVFREAGEDPIPGHRCPVSSSGDCIGRLIRERQIAATRMHGNDYTDEELELLRMTDFLARSGTPEVRAALHVVLTSLTERVSRPRQRRGTRRRRRR